MLTNMRPRSALVVTGRDIREDRTLERVIPVVDGHDGPNPCLENVSIPDKYNRRGASEPRAVEGCMLRV